MSYKSCMNSLSSILRSNLPTLDLHGVDRETARVMINDFIKENVKLKEDTLLIVHGIGSGILREATSQTLRKNRQVMDFGIHYFNSGCTVVRIKI